MGFLSKIFKGVRKVVKGVAKRIKKVGSAVWKGVKGVVKGVGKVMNKLGPLGMIGVSMIPGVGTFFSSMWNTFGSTMGAWAQTGNMLQQAIGTVGEGIFKGVNWIKGASSSLTDSVTNGIKSIGKGEFSAGMDTLSSSLTDAAAAGNSAVSSSTLSATTQSVSASADAFSQANPELLRATGSSTNATALAGEQAEIIRTADALQAGTTLGREQSLQLAEQNAGFGTEGIELTRAATTPGSAATSSTFNKVMKAGASLLESQQEVQTPYIPGYTPEAPETGRTNQIGAIGSASGGGSFLSEAQLQGYQAYWNSSLGIGKRVGGTA